MRSDGQWLLLSLSPHHRRPAPPSPPLSPYVEWSAEYNDYLVFYSEDGAGEDEEDEHSVWTWLKSVVSLVDGPMADWAEEPARGTGARGAQGR